MSRAGATPARIVLVRTSHLGDVVHALPVYHALRQAYPEAELGWVIQAEFAELIRPLPGLKHVFLFGRRDGWRAWPRLRAELRAFAPELAVDAQGSMKSAAAMLCSGAPRRVGLARVDWRERAGALVLNERAPAARSAVGGRVHAMERMSTLAQHLAERAGKVSAPRFDAALSPAELARGEQLAEAWLPRGASAPVVLHLARPSDVRSWPSERFAELARDLRAAGRGVLVLSGPAEAEQGRRLALELGTAPGFAHAVGQSGLRDLAAFFTAAAKRRATLVGCDSGPLHLATASGLPVVLLAGPQDANRTGPWPRPGANSPHRVVHAQQSPPCAPCLSAHCAHPEGPVCMTRIEVEAVRATLER